MVRFTSLAVMALAAGVVNAAPVDKNARVFVGGLEGREIYLNEMAARNVMVDPNSIVATGGVPGGSIGSKVLQGITSLFGREEIDARNVAVDPNSIVATGGVPGGSIGSKVLQGITSLFGREEIAARNVAVDPNSIVATGGVPGGSIGSKILQGITSLFGRDALSAEDGLVPRCICPADARFACGCAIEPADYLPEGFNSLTQTVSGVTKAT